MRRDSFLRRAWRPAAFVGVGAAVWIFIAFSNDADPTARSAPSGPQQVARLAPNVPTPEHGPLATKPLIHVPPASALPDLATERAAHRTRLIRRGPSPQEYVREIPPPGVRQVLYPSGSLRLAAWITQDLGDGKKHPAVVYLHGGFAFGADDWEDTIPYREAGFVVMTPMLRGENGNPGEHEWWYGEIDDAVAAGRYVAAQPYVDPDRIFVAGHSSGAAEAMLAALMPSPFKAAASFGGYVDQSTFTDDPQWRKLLPYDLTDGREAWLRSPIHYAASLRCPLYAFVGADDSIAQSRLDEFVRFAQSAEKDCRRIILPGDHHTSKPEAIRQSIALFLAIKPVN
jgi:dipeptidyl aminopeptidase/acylaminoacyl peptidase